VRLFVAVYPAAPVLDDLAGTLAGLHLARAADSGTNVRLAPREQWHLTLAFLGDVPDGRAGDAAAAVDRAVAGFEPPTLRLSGAGRFGRGRFTILWAGIGGQVAELKGLARSVHRELKRARLPRDDRVYRPHLTLARPGDRLPAPEISADLEVLRAYQSPEWTVEELRLVRSYLGPHPRYETLHTAATRPTPPDPDRRCPPAGTAHPADPARHRPA
jgi:RNA 2',3'-cyclic 3'-phosphodiesterase